MLSNEDIAAFERNLTGAERLQRAFASAHGQLMFTPAEVLRIARRGGDVKTLSATATSATPATGSKRIDLAAIFAAENTQRTPANKPDAANPKVFKVSNGALQGAELPKRLKILAWGQNETIDGPITCGTITAQQMQSNQRLLGYERVAIDLNHCSVTGTPENKELTAAGKPPMIFGYGRVNPVSGEGIYLEDVIWTPLGVQHARNFECLSPAIKEYEGEVVLVHSVALTPNGKLNGLSFY